MSRHIISQAIVLRVEPLAENHGLLSLLTPENGVVRAAAHGFRGRKSSLRPRLPVHGLVETHLFEDTQKQRWRITDAELIDDFPGIRASLPAIYHAALAAELFGRTPLEERDGWAFALGLLHLEVLAAGLPLAGIQLATLQLIWRYLGFCGHQPGLGLAGTGADGAAAQPMRWRQDMGEFVPAPDAPAGLPTVPRRALDWLRYGGERSFDEACQVGLDDDARTLLARVLIEQAESHLGRRLESPRGQESLFF